jgi:hypothetical protein
MDETSIQARVRDLLSRGVLPRPLPQKIWVGRSSGQACLICEQLIGPSEMECEVELASTVTARMHRHCFDLLLAASDDDEGLKEA